VVAPDTQYYGVFRLAGTTWVTVIDWAYSTHIQPGDAANRLRVERSGSQVTVFANGNELASAVDGTYAGELRVGLYAEAGVPVPVATRYDDVLITRLSSGRVLGSSAAPTMQSAAHGGSGSGLLPVPALDKSVD
jgi:hypothetical protein